MARKSVIKFHHLLDFFQEEVKLIQRGENAMESNHVKSLSYDGKNNTLSGCVEASMKDKTYTVQVTISAEGKIQNASCKCPRGKVRCHHMAALLLYAHHNVSVTDALCSWTKRRESKNTETKTVSELFPTKTYRASGSCASNAEVSEEILEELDKCGTVVGFGWLLRPEPENVENKLKYPTLDVILSSEQLRVAEDKAAFILKCCKLNLDQIAEIAVETIGQSKNWKWSSYRNFKLTASNFALALRAIKRNIVPPSTFKKLIGHYKLDGVKAIQWGRQHEKVAIEVLETILKTNVEETGIWFDGSGVLGASPDGFIVDDKGKAIVEVKCPYKYRDEMLSEVLKNVNNYILKLDSEGNFQINEKHDYYHQLQGQMHITRTERAYLVIWTLKECVIFPLEKNEAWGENVPLLMKFFCEKYVPYLLQK